MIARFRLDRKSVDKWKVGGVCGSKTRGGHVGYAQPACLLRQWSFVHQVVHGPTIEGEDAKEPIRRTCTLQRRDTSTRLITSGAESPLPAPSQSTSSGASRSSSTLAATLCLSILIIITALVGIVGSYTSTKAIDASWLLRQGFHCHHRRALRLLPTSSPQQTSVKELPYQLITLEGLLLSVRYPTRKKPAIDRGSTYRCRTRCFTSPAFWIQIRCISGFYSSILPVTTTSV